MRNYKSQLRSLALGAAIAAVGGAVYVTPAGGTEKATLYSPSTGLEVTNPMPLTNGSFNFNVEDTVAAVDLYILSPTGHFVVVKNVKPSGDASIVIDTSKQDTTLVIPFNHADGTAASETRTGFILPGSVQPNPAVNVTTLDDTETIDVGTLSSDSGDADGFMDGVSVAVAGYIKPTLANAGITLGTKLFVQDSANAGDEAPEQDISQIGKEVTYTLSAGSDTAAGFIILPVRLPVSSL